MSEKKKKKDDEYSLKDIYSETELELVESLRRNLTKHANDELNAGFAWEMWQRSMLRNMEQYRRENIEIIGKAKPHVQKAIDSVLDQNYKKGYSSVKQKVQMPEDGANTAPVGQKPPEENKFFGMNEKKLKVLIDTMKDDFSKVDNAIYRKMDDVYKDVISKVEFQMSTGAISLNKAIDKAVEDFLSRGIDCIAYKDKEGNVIRYVNIATYAEMALRTASQRAVFLGEGQKRDELGVHLIVVSAHANACELCLPWQAQILIDDVFSHPSKKYIAKYNKKYALLSEAIKAGFLHPNCRHTLTTYFEGVTRIPQVVDNETVQKNYQSEKKQRLLENKIKQAKRIAAGIVDEEDKREATLDLCRYQKELRDHILANPQLKRNPHREKTYGTSIKIKSNFENFDGESLKGLDERTILEVDKALTKIYKEYPNLKKVVSDIRLTDEGIANAEIEIDSRGILVSLGINKNITVEYANDFTKKSYDAYRSTKKPGIEGIIKHELGHVFNYDYYVRKHGLEYGKPYSDAILQSLIDDITKNEFATALRKDTFKQLGIDDSKKNIVRYFSKYAAKESSTNNGELFAEAFSDYSNTKAREIFVKLLKERMK